MKVSDHLCVGDVVRFGNDPLKWVVTEVSEEGASFKPLDTEDNRRIYKETAGKTFQYHAPVVNPQQTT